MRALLFITLFLLACDDGGESAADAAAQPDAGADADNQGETLDPIEIAGDYTDNFDGIHKIEANTWQQGEGDSASLFTFVVVDNEADYAVAQNGPDNMFNPGLYSRFDWAQVDGALWFCQGVFDAATAADAEAADAPDASDPANAGCSGFSWSMLTPDTGETLDPIEIAGDYTDNFDGVHRIAADTWQQGEGDSASLFTFVVVDNEADYAVAQNSPDNMFSPGLYSRFDWAEVDGTLWFCQGVFDAATAADAEAAAAPNADDPGMTGCGDFAWSSLTPSE